MTTIAYKDSIMAAEGRMSLGDCIIKEDTIKVYSVNGHLCGVCGRARAISTFVGWLQRMTDYHIVSREVGDLVDLVPPQLEDDDGYSAMVVCPDGQVLMYEGNTPIDMGVNVPMSIGSGSVYALAAMDAGASAEEAVKIAMKRDVFSGGTITTVQLEEEPDEITREIAESLDKDELIEMMFGPKETSESVETEDDVSGIAVSELEEDKLFIVKTWDNESIALYTDDENFWFDVAGIEFNIVSTDNPLTVNEMKGYAGFEKEDLIDICEAMFLTVKDSNNYGQLVRKISDEIRRTIKMYEDSNK